MLGPAVLNPVYRSKAPSVLRPPALANACQCTAEEKMFTSAMMSALMSAATADIHLLTAHSSLICIISDSLLSDEACCFVAASKKLRTHI